MSMWEVYTTCETKNWIVSQDVSFYLLWYNVISWSSHVRKKTSFLSFYSFLVKFKAIMQVTYFLNGPMFIFLFLFVILILLYIERKWFLMRNLAAILPLKSKFPGKFRRFNAIDRSIEMLKNSWIFKNSN